MLFLGKKIFLLVQVSEAVAFIMCPEEVQSKSHQRELKMPPRHYPFIVLGGEGGSLNFPPRPPDFAHPALDSASRGKIT